jgi:hypothetical protein
MSNEAWQAIGFSSPWFLAAVVIAWIVYWDYRKKVVEREERRVMIERGVTPPTPDPAGWPAVKARELELKYMERRLRIEKGLDVPPETLFGTVGPLTDMLPKRKHREPTDFLRRGLVSLCVGLAMGVSYVIVRYGGDPPPPDMASWLLALAIACPAATLYGVAHVLFYALTSRKAGEGGKKAAGQP